MRCSLLLLVLTLGACIPAPHQLTQLSSTDNPPNDATATWSETSAGASTGFVYRLHLHEKGDQNALTENNEILRTSSIQDTGLHWVSPYVLQINCLRGDVYFWVNKGQAGNQDVRIELNSNCSGRPEDQWIYIEKGTTIETIPTAILEDPRVQRSLRSDGKAVKGNLGLRILHNRKRVKEVVHVPRD